MKLLLDRKLIVQSIFIAVIYSILVTYLPNISLVWRSLTDIHTISYKTAVLVGLLGGLWTNNTPQSLLILLLTASFTGINMSLLFKRLTQLRQKGNMRLVGVSSLLGALGHGCSACGLPVLVLLGLGGSLSFLPLRGTELSYISLLFVIATFVLLLRGAGRRDDKSCLKCRVGDRH